MIIQFVLSGGLFLILLYYLSNSRRTPVISLIATGGAVSGILFVWDPALSTKIATNLGVGRGADLIFYCWGLISVALFLSVHLKFQKLNDALTLLVREMALDDAGPRATRTLPPSNR